MEGTQTNGQAPQENQPFASKLTNGPQRFLAYAIEHGLQHGRRSARDFIRHFPPKTIMEGLEDEPQLRANILVPSTGVRMKVALKKAATSCGTDLQIALNENETDPATVVALFEPDDRVRFLDNRALWSFLIEGDFWQIDRKKDLKAHTLAAGHISYLIERALEDQLLTHRDVVKGITVASMADHLPRAALPKIIEAALELGDAKKPFLERNLLASIGISTLAEYIPLVAIWARVVVPYIANAHGLSKKPDEAQAVEAHAQAREKPVEVRPPAEEPAPEMVAADPPSVEAPVPAAPAPKPFVAVARPAPTPAIAAKPSPLGDTSGLDIEVDDLLNSLTSKAALKKPFKRPGSMPPTA